MDATELIASVRAAGGMIRRDGDTIELSASVPLAADLVARVRAAKPALLAALDDIPDWHARHREALSYWGALHPEEAAGIAWGELQNRWYRLYGHRFADGQCAGCGGPLDNVLPIDLGQGNRAHLDNLNCLLRFGERWRSAATNALVGMGLRAPSGDSL